MHDAQLLLFFLYSMYLDDIRYSNNERLHSDSDQTHIVFFVMALLS